MRFFSYTLSTGVIETEIAGKEGINACDMDKGHLNTRHTFIYIYIYDFGGL